MKKLFLFLVVVTGLAFLNSCEDEIEQFEQIEKEKVVVPTNGVTAIEKEKVVVPTNG